MSANTEATIKLACCAGCRKEVESIDKRGKPRLKAGCKRHREQCWCGKCWGERFVLRAVEFPVVGPIGADWKELRESIAKAWGQSREISNWFLDELYAADVRRTPETVKLPAMPKNYLYPKARERFPHAPSALLVAIEHAVAGKYRAARYKLLWTGEATLPEYRYPVPYPVAGANWRAETIDESPCIKVPIAGQRFTLRLRGGAEFRRQLAAFRQIESGDAVAGELTLYRKRAKESDGRNGVKKNGRVQWRIMAKLVAWLPRKEQTNKPNADRFFNLRTDVDCFLYGVLQDREQPWILNADRVRDWHYQHRRWLQRMAEDSKAETRKPKRRRKRVLAEYDRRAEKYRNRMKSFIQETAAAVAAFAVRSRVTRVKFERAEKEFVDSFPWFQFVERLKIKLDEAGIEFFCDKDNASAEVESETLEPLESNSLNGNGEST